MSLDKLYEIFREAIPHLGELPDIRESVMNCTFPTAWNAETQFQFEIDSLVPDMRQQIGGPTCNVFMAALYPFVATDRFPVTVADLEEVAYKFPLLVWIAICTSSSVARLYSFSDFYYYVGANMPEGSFWRPAESSATMAASVSNISRAYAKYVMWGKILYLPSETVDPLDECISKKLFGSFTRSECGAEIQKVDKRYILPLLRHATQYDELARLLPGNVAASNHYTNSAFYANGQRELDIGSIVLILRRATHSEANKTLSTYLRNILDVRAKEEGISLTAIAMATESAGIYPAVSGTLQALIMDTRIIWGSGPQMAILFQLSLPAIYEAFRSGFPHPNEKHKEYVLRKALSYYMNRLSPDMPRSARIHLVWNAIQFLTEVDFVALGRKRTSRDQLLKLIDETIPDLVSGLNLEEVKKKVSFDQLCSLIHVIIFSSSSLDYEKVFGGHVRAVSKIDDKNVTIGIYDLSKNHWVLSIPFYEKMMRLEGYSAERLLQDATNQEDPALLDFLLTKVKLDPMLIDPLHVSHCFKRIADYLNSSSYYK